MAHLGEKLRVYTLDLAHWDMVKAILRRPQDKRNSFTQPSESAGSDPSLKESYKGVDPGALTAEEAGTPFPPMRLEKEKSRTLPFMLSDVGALSIHDMRRRSLSLIPPESQRTS